MGLTRTNAQAGKALEMNVMGSQRDVVRLEHLPSHGATFIHGGKTVRLRICCDFVGAFCATGRAIFFDAKHCQHEPSFDPGNETHVRPHQIHFLQRMGGCTRAAAGLVVERASTGEIFWLDWRHLTAGTGAIRWDDPRWVRLAAPGFSIDFRRVP